MFVTFVKWLTLGLAVVTPAKIEDNYLYLIALAGQSNMTGAGDLSLLPADFPKNRSRIWNFTNADTWEPAKEPVDSNDRQVDEVSRDKHPGVGPALAMADAFTTKYPFVKVGLIPCAKSGTRIEKWRPNASRSTLYGSCLYRQKQAEQQGKVRAMVFWQGGQDGKEKTNAMRWGQNFKKIVAAWRADMGDPNLPVILLVLKPATKEILKEFPYRDLVRDQQLSVQMPNLTKVETDGYSYNSDDIHMSTAGQLALGPAIAAALSAP